MVFEHKTRFLCYIIKKKISFFLVTKKYFIYIIFVLSLRYVHKITEKVKVHGKGAVTAETQ